LISEASGEHSTALGNILHMANILNVVIETKSNRLFSSVRMAYPGKLRSGYEENVERDCNQFVDTAFETWILIHRVDVIATVLPARQRL
jgi:hypothetical protein